MSPTARMSCAAAICITRPRASPGYDSALQLGLRSLVADEAVKGEISIATTGVGDPAAFARVQAGTLAPDKALEEAYRRNNSGSYAEAAEFFAAASSNVADARRAAPRHWSTKRCRSPTSAALPKRIRCSPAPPSRSASTRSSLDVCATIARSTDSTRAMPRTR